MFDIYMLQKFLKRNNFIPISMVIFSNYVTFKKQMWKKNMSLLKIIWQTEKKTVNSS